MQITYNNYQQLPPFWQSQFKVMALKACGFYIWWDGTRLTYRENGDWAK